MKKLIIWVTVFTVSLSLLLFVPFSVNAEDFEEPDYPSQTPQSAEQYWQYVYLPIIEFYSPTKTMNPYYHEYDYYYNFSASSSGRYAEMTKDIVRTQIMYGQGDYQSGYQDGKDDAIANDFNIKDMIFSIIDAPFRVVREALNFEIFGIEVSSLVLGLFSVVLVIFVIRRLKA